MGTSACLIDFYGEIESKLFYNDNTQNQSTETPCFAISKPGEITLLESISFFPLRLKDANALPSPISKVSL